MVTWTWRRPVQADSGFSAPFEASGAGNPSNVERTWPHNRSSPVPRRQGGPEELPLPLKRRRPQIAIPLWHSPILPCEEATTPGAYALLGYVSVRQHDCLPPGNVPSASRSHRAVGAMPSHDSSKPEESLPGSVHCGYQHRSFVFLASNAPDPLAQCSATEGHFTGFASIADRIQLQTGEGLWRAAPATAKPARVDAFSSDRTDFVPEILYGGMVQLAGV